MTTTYTIQRGTLSGSFETVYSTRHVKAAWKAYFKTRITTGEKKRIQEKRGKLGTPRTLKSDREYWT
jgi:hypothetical protein